MTDQCPNCGSEETESGYGFAAGPLAMYVMCADCSEVLEIKPDLDGIEEPPGARDPSPYPDENWRD